MNMEKRLVTACMADLTSAREQKLRQAAQENGFELKVVKKGEYTAQDLAGSEILFGNYPPAMLKEVSRRHLPQPRRDSDQLQRRLRRGHRRAPHDLHADADAPDAGI